MTDLNARVPRIAQLMLNAICRATGWSWFVYWDETHHHAHLWIGDPRKPIRRAR